LDIGLIEKKNVYLEFGQHIHLSPTMGVERENVTPFTTPMRRPSLLKDLNGRRDLQHAIFIAKGQNSTTSVIIKHDKENNAKTMKTTRSNHSNSLPKENKH
jgi:hypothetical protein